MIGLSTTASEGKFLPRILGGRQQSYAPLARAMIGGLAVFVVVTVFLVPAGYLLVHGRHEQKTAVAGEV